MIKKYATPVIDNSAANQLQIAEYEFTHRRWCTFDSALADAETQKTGNPL